jgi:alkaline phosphatase
MGARRIRTVVLAVALVAVTSPTVGVRAGPGAQAVEPAQPKNIILMVGDGMGPAHVDLARRFVGGPLAMDVLDTAPGSMAHDNIDGEVTDSAASATAFATGRKTVNGAMSVDRDGKPMETAWERAEARGKATGIVSSVFLIDATPGVWAAHSADRYAYGSIAKQQALGIGTWGSGKPYGGIDGAEVLLGAGAMYYRPQGANGTGDVNLIDELVDRGYQYVRKASELERADPARRLLGFFGGAMMTYALDRPLKKGLTEPTLAQMTDRALDVVSRDGDGFLLVVEGGAIDWAAHKEDAAGTLREVLAFDAAVDVARRFAAERTDTLLIVVADHETGGLSLGAAPNLAFLGGVRATVDTIWAGIEGGMTIDAAMKTYAGIGGPWPGLTARERDAIRMCGDPLGIADVLNARAGIGWGWGGCEGAHHTPTKVLVFAAGPGAAAFNGSTLDNTDIGKALFAALP